MSRPERYRSRVAFTLALMLAIAGLAGVLRVSALPAAAQDAGGVLVSCAQPLAGGSTTCVISAPGASQLSVPAGGVCGTFSSTSGWFDGASYVSASGSPSVSFTYSTPVTIGGGALYGVTVGGATALVGGLTILCSQEASPPPAPDGAFGLPDEDVGDTPGGDGGSEWTVPVEDGSQAGSPEAGAPAGASDSGAGDSGFEPASVIVDPDSTSDPEIEAVPVTVTIVAYRCETDPGTADPAGAGCTPAEGLTYSAEDSSGGLGTAQSNASGIATFDSTAGFAFIVTQTTNIDGYRPIGDGRYEILQLTGDTTITFVNVLRPELGRLQIVAGLCPTSGASRTEFSIADQSHFGTASLETCQANGGAVFTVTSSALPGGAWAVRVEADGTWRGHVPAGTYTVTAPDGTVSDPIVVIQNAVSVAVAVTYVAQEQGTLRLEHFICSGGTDGEYVVINPAGGPDASCIATPTVVYVSDALINGPDTAITIAQNGHTSVALKPGLYRVTGPTGVATELVTVTAEATAVARFLTVATTGSLIVAAFQCPPGSIPADLAATCTTAWGNESFSLIPASGTPQVVTTSGAGSAVVLSLQPGTYVIEGGNVCAVQSGGADVSGGFQITAGGTTVISVYGCTPSDGTGSPSAPGNGGGPSNGDGTGGTNNPVGSSGGDGTGGGESNGAYGSNSAINVTQLPNTGAGATPSDYWWPALLLIASGMLMVTGRRWQVARKAA